MRLRANVLRVTGNTSHSLGTVEGNAPIELEKLPAPSWVEIIDQSESFLLLYHDHEGKCIADTWHQSLESAMSQARFEFEIEDNDWERIA